MRILEWLNEEKREIRRGENEAEIVKEIFKEDVNFPYYILNSLSKSEMVYERPIIDTKTKNTRKAYGLNTDDFVAEADGIELKHNTYRKD